MAGALARWIVENGIENAKPESLSTDMRKEVFTEAGMILLNEGRIYEAVQAIVMAQNESKLLEMGDEFLRQSKFDEAALCFIPTKDKARLEKAAGECAKQGNVHIAYYAYSAAGNEQMALFLKDNFCPNA